MEGEKLFTGIEIILELVRKYYSPLCKGGWGGIFSRRSKANPSMSPFFKGGFKSDNLFKDKLLERGAKK